MKNTGPHIVLRTQDLQIGYQKKRNKRIIASNIHVEAKEGELIAVIGVNGVGKSTLLKTLSGIQPELGGNVIIHGEDRSTFTPEKLAALVSLVLTEQPLSKNLSVNELVALGRQPYTNWIGSLSLDDRDRIKEALKLVNIEHIQHRKCYELSDGQLQKVLIARALAQDTPIMILDEPTSHLDMHHKAQVLKLLKQLSQETGKAILFATHEINLALELCDKIILMTPKGVVEGSPQKLIQKRVFNSLFPSDLIFFDSTTRSFRIKN